MSHVVVSDENGNKFTGFLTDPHVSLPSPGSDDTVKVFVLFDGRTNGFGSSSPDVKDLKRLNSGDFGS